MILVKKQTLCWQMSQGWFLAIVDRKRNWMHHWNMQINSNLKLYPKTENWTLEGYYSEENQEIFLDVLAGSL